jgi:hypothetical protein
MSTRLVVAADDGPAVAVGLGHAGDLAAGVDGVADAVVALGR